MVTRNCPMSSVFWYCEVGFFVRFGLQRDTRHRKGVARQRTSGPVFFGLRCLPGMPQARAIALILPMPLLPAWCPHRRPNRVFILASVFWMLALLRANAPTASACGPGASEDSTDSTDLPSTRWAALTVLAHLQRLYKNGVQAHLVPIFPVRTPSSDDATNQASTVARFLLSSASKASCWAASAKFLSQSSPKAWFSWPAAATSQSAGAGRISTSYPPIAL